MKETSHAPRRVTDPQMTADARCRPSRASENTISRILLRLVDAGLVGVIFLAPLFMGGRYDVGRLVYVAVVCFTAACWAVRQCVVSDARWRWSGAELILLAGLLLIVLQLMPLPQSLLLWLSPEIGELLPLWSSHTESAAQMGTWNELTLTPQATRGGLVTFLAHVMLFLVVVQRIREFSDLERLMRWLAIAAIGMAVLGLAQFLLGNGKFLWIYDHPSRDTSHAVKGTFQNKNHFAHFLALGIGPLIWWLQRQWASHSRGHQSFGRGGRSNPLKDMGKHSLAIGLGIVALAGLLTFSRGGVIAMFVAATVCLAIFVWRRLLGRKTLFAVAGLVVLLVGALSIHGYEPLARRLATLRDSRSLDELSHGRKALWAAHMKAIPRFALTGTGAGSHELVYRTYLDEHFDLAFTHGENGYLHLLLETGIPGLALMLAAAGLALYWCIRTLFIRSGRDSSSGEENSGTAATREPGRSRKREGKTGKAGRLGRSATPSNTELAACAAALLAGLAASMIHSVGDFVWYIPACMSLTIIIAACACRLFQMSMEKDKHRVHRVPAESSRTLAQAFRRAFVPDDDARMPRFAWITATVVLCGAVSMMLANRVPPALAASHWDAYFRLVRTTRGASLHDEKALKCVPEMRTHLENLLERDPYNARANVRLAGIYVRQFDMEQQRSENPMPLSQIRDAALASPFSSREAQDQWLSIVLGKNRTYLDKAIVHAKRGLRLCPLQGVAYVHLAELAFLHSNSPERKHAHVAQAIRVRPHDGSVLFAAGREAMLAGDIQKALDLWKRSFHQDPKQQSQIIELLAPRASPDDFVRHFDPDVVGMGKLFSHLRRTNRVEEAQSLGHSYVAVLEQEARDDHGVNAARRWDQARAVHDFLGNAPRAVDCARQAVSQTPTDFGKRRTLATTLLKSGQYDEAVRELQWCLRRHPDDQNLKQMLQTASRARIARPDTTPRQTQANPPVTGEISGQRYPANSGQPSVTSQAKRDLAAFDPTLNSR